MEEQVIAGAEAGASVDRQQQTLDSFGEAASESKPCAEMADMSGASVPRAMLKCRRGNQVPDLNLSLLPSRERLELFGAPQQADQTPFAGSPHLNCGGVTHFTNVNNFRYRKEGIAPLSLDHLIHSQRFLSPSMESKRQQDHAPLTIFYGGTVYKYNVSTNMAKVIMMVANSNNSPTSLLAFPSPSQECHTPSSTGHVSCSESTLTQKPVKLAISRQNSLKCFLEKRKDRNKASYSSCPNN